jgi:hypothetical protein
MERFEAFLTLLPFERFYEITLNKNRIPRK